MRRSPSLPYRCALLACLFAAGVSAAPTTLPLVTCTTKQPLRVHFYNVGQGLAALVDLPDGRHILIDAGPPVAHNLVPSLQRDLAGAPIDLLWVTHQHIDHVGGADNVINAIKVLNYAHNGRSSGMPEVAKALKSARATGAKVHSFVPPSPSVAPLPSTRFLAIKPIVPSQFLAICKYDENFCSIGLRIDYCKSSLLFVGDAEDKEEALMSPQSNGNSTLLQLGHHGSDTSTSDPFLARVAPRYAVISSGTPMQGANVGYCHPRISTVQKVTKLLGGAGAKTIQSFDGTAVCGPAVGQGSHWKAIPSSDRIWSTARDGDVVLTTTGDGVFTRL